MRLTLIILGLGLTSAVCASKKIDSLISVATDKNSSAEIQMSALANIVDDITWFDDNMESVETFTNKLWQLSEEHESWNNKIRAIESRARISHRRQDFKNAIDYCNYGLTLSKKENVSPGKLYGLLAVLQFNMGNMKQALKYQRKDLREREYKSDDKGRLYHNMGYVLQENLKYDSAIYFYNLSIENSKRTNNHVTMANALAYKGETYALLKEYDSALFYLQNGIDHKIRHGISYELVWNQIKTGEVLNALGRYNEAIEKCISGISLSEDINIGDENKYACKCLIEAYKCQKNYERAFEYSQLYHRIRDEMRVYEISEEIKAMENSQTILSDSLKQVLLFQKREEIAKSELLKKKRRNRIQYSLAIIAVLILATAIAIVTRFKISPRLASGLIFIFFILTFEFLLVVLDPWVDSISDGEVGWKIAINTAIALVLFGIHQVSEKKLKTVILKSDK
ncbi:MAG: tetratricopeptide repeat protein [Bacteroidia bacterium]